MQEELATIGSEESRPPGSDEAWIFPSRLEDFGDLGDITALFRRASREIAANKNGSTDTAKNEKTEKTESGDAAEATTTKQRITQFADLVRIDWEGLLHGRTWQDLTNTEIEDAIVLALFQRACASLPGDRRAKLAADLIKSSGNPNILNDLTSGSALILAKLTSQQLQLLRATTWDLARAGSKSAGHDNTAPGGATGLATGKSTILGNVEITGSIAFRGELIFDGSLKSGGIIGDALQVGKNAKIKGDIMVDTLDLSGKVTGNTTATGRCELDSTAEVIGTLTATRLAMAEGATLVGEVRLGPAA